MASEAQCILKIFFDLLCFLAICVVQNIVQSQARFVTHLHKVLAKWSTKQQLMVCCNIIHTKMIAFNKALASADERNITHKEFIDAALQDVFDMALKLKYESKIKAIAHVKRKGF
ncbi:hypothetical protein DEU56DRAFT_755176 [Suillus clintonianus]|uniref:uncharacterized protein n=1 Tax=Suillus clintonianus TaxID=1904413 RepID=UPI001B87BAF3|nr:uncharacterized protein DEU56DRAFT_755176 [Suillus clintonianus]KAG2140558.1 hypothetical protein DEU56DRAFT_755176 [Suillus clintonianus]